MPTPARARMEELLSRLPEEPADDADPLAALEEPSPYLNALCMAYLLAPDGCVEEDVLRALALGQMKQQGFDEEELLETVSSKLRAEGLLA